MKKITLILVMFLVVLMAGIGTVSAETLTGSLTGSNYTQLTYGNGHAVYQGSYLSKWYFNDIENSAGLTSMVFFPTSAMTYDVGAPAGATTNVSIHSGSTGGPVIGTGTIGYQRQWNGAETGGYFWIWLNNWNITGLSGDYYDCYVQYDHAALYNVTSMDVGSSVLNNPSGSMQWYGFLSGSYLYTYSFTFDNEYSATKPYGIGITGNVTKTVNGVVSGSKVYIINATSGATIANEGTVNTNNYNFSTIAETIIIAVEDGQGSWYNSSSLFSITGAIPTPTPTPTTTAEPTPVPGYVRTYAHVKDRGGNLIHGANINIKDTFGNVWRNSSSDADGISYIDTLPNAYVNIYADFTVFENEFLPGSLLTQAVGPGGNTYYLVLYPYESGATEGNVSLYVEVKDVDGSFIPYANVQIVLSNGYSYSGSTANQGSKVFLVPNDTVVRATGTAPGYMPATVIGNSGAGGSMTMTIELHRQTVTTRPTSTIPPGGVTPAITVDPNDPSIHGGDTSFKAQEMMNFLAMNGMDLVQVCFMVTILALLGFKFGK